MTILHITPLGQSLDAVSESGAVTWESTTLLRAYGRGRVHMGPAGAGLAFVTVMPVNNQGVYTVMDLAGGWIIFHFRIDTLPATTAEVIARAVTGSSTRKMDLDITSGGLLKVQNRTGSDVATGATEIQTGVVYRIAIYSENGTTGDYEVWLAQDGQPWPVSAELSGTCDQGATQLDRWQLGKVSNKNSSTMSMYYGDVVIDDSTKHGHYYIGIALPRGNGANTSWTDDWDECDEYPHDGDTSVITTNVSGNIETFVMTAGADLGIGASDTISAVLGVTLRKGNAAVVNEAANVTFVSGASTTHNSNANLATSGSGYAFGAFIKLVNPDGGGAWTRSAFDAIEVGARTNSAFAWSITSVMAYVMFTPATTIPTFRGWYGD